MTLRNGKSMISPWYSHASFQNIGRQARTASSQTSRLLRNLTSNGWSSVVVADSPMPNSTRPFDTRSSVDTRSATRAGWFVVSWMMPWPRRIWLVRWLPPGGKTPGRGGGGEPPGKGGVRVLLEEVGLALPGVVVAEPVRELDLHE